ncbi:hypothetical protein PF002_g2908 [Phytophthora fragariae]|uniref:Major facilitator superfamily (MFS) profile domain-containing protein n=1 Tax=Phytophthora fragariae TaxID=53985 RepID=A0A6A4ACF2_9STRA|nr:hypothetical protein PF002_g2908 [Phytophthora fragariae]
MGAIPVASAALAIDYSGFMLARFFIGRFVDYQTTTFGPLIDLPFPAATQSLMFKTPTT